jgi:hypothetical protein
MRSFDPIEERHSLLGDCGYDFDLTRDIGEAKGVGGRGSSSDAFLGAAIRCMLNGLREPASQLLRKSEKWVTAALDEDEIPRRYLHDERYSPDGEAALRYRTLALCGWLLHDQHDTESFRRFVECEDGFFGKSPAGKDKVNVSLALPTYVDAEAFHRVLQLFASTTGLTEPKSLGSIRSEAQMSFVLCCRRLGEKYGDDDVAAGVGKFLDRNVDGWLSNGHFVRAAEWMKIVYWQKGVGGGCAKDALLKCYDHLQK